MFSRDKTLLDFWSIWEALSRSFYTRHFERREGSGDQIDQERRFQQDAHQQARR